MEAEMLTAEVFAPHVGSVFTIVAGDERCELVLDRVETRPELMEGATHPDGTPVYTRAPFNLTFSGPREALFGQATFEVRHAVLGRLVLFIKPFSVQGTKAYYESIFS